MVRASDVAVLAAATAAGPDGTAGLALAEAFMAEGASGDAAKGAVEGDIDGANDGANDGTSEGSAPVFAAAGGARLKVT